MLLRLKGETEDETLDAALPEPSDRITPDDVFPEDGMVEDEEDDGEEPDGFPPTVRGLGIAAACFIPTFLVVFLGLPYVLGSAIPARTLGPPSPAPAASSPFASDLSAPATPPLSDAIRDPFVAPQMPEPAVTRRQDPREMSRPSEPRESPRESRGEDAAPSAVELPAPPAAPALPPAEPRAAEPRVAEPRAARPQVSEPRAPGPLPRAAAPRPAPESPPAAEPRRLERDWTPAAAFTDREAATRLASSIQQQGYPVEIRQDRSSTRPWVVWIGARPRDGERRR